MEKNVFLTEDIRINNERMPEEYENGFEGFDLTEDWENFLEFVASYSKKATEDEKKTAQSFLDVFPESLADVKHWIDEGGHGGIYEEWQDEASHEERYKVPMMNALRYYPDFVDFEEADRYKVAGNTCLLYDNELEAWAVGMTGGGMDLSPHLVDTFIELEKGVPLELAGSMRLNYNAYVEPERHKRNCRLITKALINKGLRLIREASHLDPEGEEIDPVIFKRHLKGIETALEKQK